MEAPRASVSRLIASEPASAAGSGVAGQLERLCGALVRVVPASGSAVSLITESGGGGAAAASDAASRRINELQFALGEGAALDAFATRRPVLVSDLDRDAAQHWPAYAPAMQAAGVRAVFAFPVQSGEARLGVLDVYRDVASPLTTQALAQLQTFADVAMTTLLDAQDLADDGDQAAGLDHTFVNRLELYQAQGMVMVQLDVPLVEATIRLRAHAYAAGRRLDEVSRDVVARRLKLERDLPKPP